MNTFCDDILYYFRDPKAEGASSRAESLVPPGATSESLMSEKLPPSPPPLR
jgi:hypothetical protein